MQEQTDQPEPSKDLQHSAMQFRRWPIVVSLVLALLLVFGVLVGAKIVYGKFNNQPVPMSPLDTPLASSTECTKVVEDLPDKFFGYQRAQILDPVPPGAAAWQKDPTHRITLRCGVTLPLQYTALSSIATNENTGIQWLRVVDQTPGSTMQTWYSVNTSPVIAVSADTEAVPDSSVFTANTDLEKSVSDVQKVEPKPYPVPLADLSTDAADKCSRLGEVLPAEIGSDPTYTRYEGSVLPHNSWAWTVEGFEPIVLRCGVAFPASYKAGLRVEEVNGVTWFEDTTLRNGTTASTWYAVDRKNVIALSVPQYSGNSALVQASEAIKKALPEETS